MSINAQIATDGTFDSNASYIWKSHLTRYFHLGMSLAFTCF